LGYQFEVWVNGVRVLTPGGAGGFVKREEAEAFAIKVEGVVVDTWKPQVKFTLGPGARLPEYAHHNDSGADLFSCEACSIIPGDTRMIDTGLHMELPVGFEGQIRSKSGLACKQSVFVLNSPGTVDTGYRGPVKVILHNAGIDVLNIAPGDKIAQLVIVPVQQAEFHAVEVLSDSARGEAGFGSTGK
jgi:dUTP pyrophosphatase